MTRQYRLMRANTQAFWKSKPSYRIYAIFGITLVLLPLMLVITLVPMLAYICAYPVFRYFEQNSNSRLGKF